MIGLKNLFEKLPPLNEHKIFYVYTTVDNLWKIVQ